MKCCYAPLVSFHSCTGKMWTVPPIIMSFDSILLFTVADFQVIHLEDVANSVQSLKPPADGHALTSLEIHDALKVLPMMIGLKSAFTSVSLVWPRLQLSQPSRHHYPLLDLDNLCACLFPHSSHLEGGVY